jgi:hypothetical protein
MKDFSKYKLNVKKSPHDPRVYKAKHHLKAIVLPEVLDYRDVFDRYFPVIDQGEQGSCAACAGTAMRQYQEFVDTGLIKKLSEQFIYNNREGLGEEGMYMKDLMRILYKVGVCLNKLCPYGNTEPPTAQAYKDALKRVIQGYARVDTIEELKVALYLQGPCPIAVPVYNYGNRMWYRRAGDGLLGGHAMCCVGYNAEGFIIRNSWSTEWADRGYTILPYGDFECIWEEWTAIDAPTKTTTIEPTTTVESITTTEEQEKTEWPMVFFVFGIIGIVVTTIIVLIVRSCG